MNDLSTNDNHNQWLKRIESIVIFFLIFFKVILKNNLKLKFDKRTFD